MKKNPLIIVIILAIFMFATSSFYILPQFQTALLLQFGETVKIETKPGLKFKIPFIQKVVFYDNRILDVAADEKEVIAADQKRLIVNAFAKYRITDPLKFYQTVKDENGMRNRLVPILESSLRQVLGSVPLSTLLTGERSAIMRNIQQVVDHQAGSFGVEIVDVRIKRADLPKENSEAIFLRMQTEREREAKEFRAQGAEEGQIIKSKADKERAIILAEAQKQSQIIRGQGDSKATKIFADAFGKDPEFYGFYRSMQAYSSAIDSNSTVILSPDNEFLNYFYKGTKN